MVRIVEACTLRFSFLRREEPHKSRESLVSLFFPIARTARRFMLLNSCQSPRSTQGRLLSYAVFAGFTHTVIGTADSAQIGSPRPLKSRCYK